MMAKKLKSGGSANMSKHVGEMLHEYLDGGGASRCKTENENVNFSCNARFSKLLVDS